MEFEAWMEYVFLTDKESDSEADLARLDYIVEPDWEVIPEVVSHMTHLFNHAGELLAPYSDEVVSYGLDYIINEAGGCVHGLYHSSLSQEQQIAWVRSHYPLFRHVFAKRCAPVLGHTATVAHNRLNSLCYMWWDIIPVSGDPEINPLPTLWFEEALDTMRQILNIPHVACQESAIHGLGHWYYRHQHRVSRILNAYILSGRGLRAGLHTYALNARKGGIL